MKTIIITADDYGMCYDVDQAIRECMKAGVVTSTNVIINMETIEEASVLRTEYPDISVGIHWNVTTGRPVSNIDDVKTLVDEDGVFFSLKAFRERVSRGLINRRELERELLAQYNIFTRLCGQPDYWNTHEDSVLCLASFKVFSKVAKKLNIASTRNFQRVYIDIESVSAKSRLKEFVKSRIFDIWFVFFVKKNFAIPEGKLFSFDLRNKLNTETLVSKLIKSHKKLIEIVIHPAITADNPLYGNISDERLEEYKFFGRSQLCNVLSQNGLRLGNFETVLQNRRK